MKKFINEHTVVFFIIMVIVTTPVLWYLLDFPLNALGLNDQYSQVVKNLATAAVCIAFMYRTFGSLTFSLKGKHFFKSLFTFGLLGVLGSIGAFFFTVSDFDLKPTAFIIIGYLAMNLAVAVNEELVFRGIIMNTMRKVWGGQNNAVMKAVLLSSMIFGLKHFTNLIAYPNQIIMTFAQVIFTIMAGVYLAAVYVRSQNIWVGILIHFLEDTAATIMAVFSTQAAATSVADTPVLQAFMMLLIQIPYVWIGILMLKGKKVKNNNNSK